LHIEPAANPPASLAEKSAQLERALSELDSLLVAYSGGTDSAYLAWAAHRMLGGRMLAVIADSASLPRKELADALAFTDAHRIPTQVLSTRELDDPDYVRNDTQRCFHCKDELFTRMEALRCELGFAHMAYGMNRDDQAPGTVEFRPGQQAAARHGALAPLAAAGLSKAEVRALARAAGLTLADKPASACLASRIEYGRPVTAHALAQVEAAEAALHALGFPQVRVRHHGELARLEIDRADLPRALSLELFDRIAAALRPLGFVYIALDMQGYRSGAMNEVVAAFVPAAALVSAR